MEAYLFVHFREKDTPEGEQVYFALSRDGLRWETVNDGQPVLTSEKGDCGVRDHSIVRTNDGKFYILSTDLGLARHFRGKYRGDWSNITRRGSKCLALWESADLTNWSEQRMLELGDDRFGCLWAPDVIYDREHGDYAVHWSSLHADDGCNTMAIYYSRTEDFTTFSEPRLLCRKEEGSVIDSAIYEANGVYYRFLKREGRPPRIILERGTSPTGEYERIAAFDEEMDRLGDSAYEAPTMFRLQDGRYCLMLDYYGVPGEGQGYVPFVADDLAEGRFVRSDESFRFPYGFKHGTVLPITLDEYERIREKWRSQ